MEGASEAQPDAGGFAKHACGYCRQKKIKCSKEIPKCAACKPWPGPCVYNKHGPPGKGALPKGQVLLKPPFLAVVKLDDNSSELEDVKAVHIKPQPENVNIQTRLDRIEASLGQITAVLGHLVKISEGNNIAAKQGAPAAEKPSFPPPGSEETLQPSTYDDGSHEDSPRSSNLFGTMSQTSHDLSNLQAYPELATEHENASRELRGLLDSLKSFDIVGDRVSDINPSSQYFIPDKATGYALVGQVLHVTELGSVLFTQPTDEIVRQVIFEPTKVKNKAWLLYINYTMVAVAGSAKGQFEPGFINSLRWNTRLALNNSSLFLEPSELNIQALLLAALHGEDFAAPNLSWMLIGHACQQAKALLPSSTTQDFREQQRRLCLFWSLFSVDKSCSLAFGRPVFLPASIFKAIPLPDSRYLHSYNPHGGKQASTDGNELASTFGANVFLQSISLALLTSKISDFLHEGGSDTDCRNLIAQLDNWHRSTEELLYNGMESERSFSTSNQLHEMSLGILSSKFQYLHLLMSLTEKSEHHVERRIASAREAISILPKMVSNWNQVYNGIIWHSLYYPFTPFFVLFQRVIQNPFAEETMDDLRLLASTVAYFTSMGSQVSALGPLVRKLEQTAEVLLSLAQRHVIVSASRRDGGIHNASTVSVDGLFSSGMQPDQHHSFSMESMDMPSFMEDIDMDNFISWLPQGMGSELDLSALGDGAWDSQAVNQHHQRQDDGTEPRGRKRPFECAFDWFSWDTQFM